MPAPEVIAHRGIRDRYPENSLPAFEAALDAGVDAIELDVHATSDGVVVVHHDARLTADSSSDHAGRAISSLSSDTLSGFELSPGVSIPSLESVFELVSQRAKLYIEIKATHIESRVAAVVSRLPDRIERCSVHSFDHRIVAAFHKISPRVPTGILLVGYPIDPPALLGAANATDLWQEREFIDEALIESVHRAGRRVIAWTSNDPSEWTRFRKMGVDGICTDRSDALATAFRE